MITRLNTWITHALLAVAAVLAFLIAFLVCADVIGRDAFNAPVRGTPEIVSFSIVIICFLQAPFAIRSGGMIRVDALIMNVPRLVRRILEIFGYALGAVFFALVCWGSIDPAIHAWTSNEFEGEGALRVPVWPARFVIIFGTALAAFNYLLLFAERMRAPLDAPAVGSMPH
ncbi:MAG: TRAP transporter small permease [Betaproteobacteria bacterium]|nr:TRAP transporter small permease [Betaproteobacteria bacterium]